MFKLLLLMLSYFVYFANSQNYCDRNLCSSGRHIGCHNDFKLSISCSSSTRVVDMDPLKDEIVHKHNELRNKVASGSLKPFKSASRMATMEWNNELAKLAELNVKRCIFAHDDCRNTYDFKYSGQNLAYWSSYPAKTPIEAITKGIESWFNEHLACNPNDISAFPERTTKEIGHFTVMVSDRNTDVGCAMIRSKEGISIKYVTACNYATTNIIGYPIYKAGKAASKCTTGSDTKYASLCSRSENINANEF